jgi:hypothetical protein
LFEILQQREQTKLPFSHCHGYWEHRLKLSCSELRRNKGLSVFSSLEKILLINFAIELVHALHYLHFKKISTDRLVMEK